MSALSPSFARARPQDLPLASKNRSLGERLMQTAQDADAVSVGMAPEGFRAVAGPNVHLWDTQLLDEIGVWYVAAAARAGVAEIARALMALTAVEDGNNRLIEALGITKNELGQLRLPQKLSNTEEQSRILMRTIAEHAFNTMLISLASGEPETKTARAR